MSAIIRAVLGYLFLVFMMRIVGRRPGKQLTPFEYILIFFEGGLTLTALIGDDHSLTNALVVIMTVGFSHYALAWGKQHSQWLGRIIDGTPLVLIGEGKRFTDAMTNAGIVDDDIMTSARDKGLRSFDQIRYAILERNGEISIISHSV